MFSLNRSTVNNDIQNLKTQYRSLLRGNTIINNTTTLGVVTGINDTQITQSQQYSQLANSRFSTVVYKAPKTIGNVYLFNDPVFNGHVTINGNIDVVYNQGQGGFLNVNQDAVIQGSLYVTNVVISGSIILPNSKGFSFVGNTSAPYLLTVVENANSIYVNKKPKVTYVIASLQAVGYSTDYGQTFQYVTSNNFPFMVT